MREQLEQLMAAVEALWEHIDELAERLDAVETMLEDHDEELMVDDARLTELEGD